MFQFRPEHAAVWRKQAVGKGLCEILGGGPFLATQDQATSDVIVADRGDRQFRLRFNDEGSIGTVESTLGRQWNLQSDAQGRLEGVVNPAGYRVAISHDARDLISGVDADGNALLRCEYDGRRNLTQAQFHDGTARRFEYGPEDQTRPVRSPTGSGSPNAITTITLAA